MMVGRGVRRSDCAYDSPRRSVTVDYLAQTGWPGSERDSATSSGLHIGVDYTWLDIDVGETFHPKIGLGRGHRSDRERVRPGRLNVGAPRILSSLAVDGGVLIPSRWVFTVVVALE